VETVPQQYMELTVGYKSELFSSRITITNYDTAFQYSHCLHDAYLKYKCNGRYTNNVRIKENIIPPITTIPKGMRLVAAEPKLKAMGKAPNEVARLVIQDWS